MRALITGASSGIGKAIAYELANKNIDLILIARRESLLKEIKLDIEAKYQIKVDYLCTDISKLDNVNTIYQYFPDIDILVNNAGYGTAGEFVNIDLDNELTMIDLNIKSLHILTKLYGTSFALKNKGYIMNVASIASFQPGPRMATYYATKAYVLSLSSAVNYELKKANKKVKISVLCPGPVNTEFNDVANVKLAYNGISAEKAAKIAVKGLFKGKPIIFTTFKEKAMVFLERFISRKLLLKIIYKIQAKKTEK